MEPINFLEARSFRFKMTGWHACLGFLTTFAFFTAVHFWQNTGLREDLEKKTILEEEVQGLRLKTPQSPVASGQAMAEAYGKRQLWAPRLRLITGAIPPAIRLRVLHLSSNPEPLVILKGSAFSLGAIHQLKEKLAALEGIKTVTLLSSSLDKDKAQQQSFEMELRF